MKKGYYFAPADRLVQAIVCEWRPLRTTESHSMLRIESEREDDGRWIAEVPALPGVMSYGATEDEARAKVKALALRVIADRLDNGET